MAVKLSKGQKVDLTKTNPGLTLLNFGMGWGAYCDLDYGAACFDEEGKFIPGSFIYFRNKSNANGSIQLDKDDTVGGGDPKVSKENCRLDLRNIPANVQEIKFGGWVYTGCRNYGEAGGAFMQLRDISKFPDIRPNSPDYKPTVAKGPELANYYLSDEFAPCTAVCLGSVYRYNGEWKTQALGIGLGGGMDGLRKFFETGYITPPPEAKKSSSQSAANTASRIGSNIGNRLGGALDALLGRR